MATKPRKPRLRALTGEKPDPSWNGWRNFLKSCELVAEDKGNVTFYRKTNRNYLVLANGIIIQNYGYLGHGLYSIIVQHGWQRTLSRYQAMRKEIDKKLKA